MVLAKVVTLQRGPCQSTTICMTEDCPDSMRRPQHWCLEDYDLEKQLYRGKASLLYKARCQHSGVTVALKLYRKHKLSELNWYQVAREIQIHSHLRHDHIIQLYGAFEDSKHVYLVQEFATGGDLYEELRRNGGRLKEEEVAMLVIRSALLALNYMHSQGVVHRDIKPENILVAGSSIKLADFGLSINAEHERPVTRAGTLDYMAPEVLVCPEKCYPEDNKEKALLVYDRHVDSWAMGVLTFELIVGRPPFEKETRAATYEAIMYRNPAFPAWISDCARGFITSALIKSSKARPEIMDLLGHPFCGCKAGDVVTANIPLITEVTAHAYHAAGTHVHISKGVVAMATSIMNMSVPHHSPFTSMSSQVQMYSAAATLVSMDSCETQQSDVSTSLRYEQDQVVAASSPSDSFKISTNTSEESTAGKISAATLSELALLKAANILEAEQHVRPSAVSVLPLDGKDLCLVSEMARISMDSHEKSVMLANMSSALNAPVEPPVPLNMLNFLGTSVRQLAQRYFGVSPHEGTQKSDSESSTDSLFQMQHPQDLQHQQLHSAVSHIIIPTSQEYILGPETNDNYALQSCSHLSTKLSGAGPTLAEAASLVMEEKATVLIAALPPTSFTDRVHGQSELVRKSLDWQRFAPFKWAAGSDSAKPGAIQQQFPAVGNTACTSDSSGTAGEQIAQAPPNDPAVRRLLGGKARLTHQLGTSSLSVENTPGLAFGKKYAILPRASKASGSLKRHTVDSNSATLPLSRKMACSPPRGIDISCNSLVVPNPDRTSSGNLGTVRATKGWPGGDDAAGHVPYSSFSSAAAKPISPLVGGMLGAQCRSLDDDVAQLQLSPFAALS